MATTWRGNGTTKYGTWNVRGIAGKEVELVEEMKRASVQVLAITETKKKGTGCAEIEDGFILIHSGVQANTRAKAGVAFLVHKDTVGQIENWKYINERILTLKLKDPNNKETFTLIAVYGPNEDELTEAKDKFFETLQRTTDDEEGPLWILGDLNGRVGNCQTGYDRVLGPYGEETRNNNGKRLLQFCLANELVLLNTKYPHKDIHKITRENRTRNERSIIDYIIGSRSLLQRVRDVRVKRGPEIGSDHYLLVVNISVPILRRNRKKRKKNITERIKSFKLKEKETAEEYAAKVEQGRGLLGPKQNTNDLEEAWENFKSVIIKAAEESCGREKCGKGKKRTRWWTEILKEEVKKKKELWKQYLTVKDQESYENYKHQRKKVKELVLKEKEKSWKEFGEFMEDKAKSNQKLFYKVLKNMRKEKECPIKFVKAKDGKILRDPIRIMERWREHFKELLAGRDLIGGDRDVIREEENGGEREELWVGEDDPIEKEEMWDALEKMKLGKSAGHDGITPEMLRYMGGAGEDLLFKVMELAWYYKKIPRDWEVSIIVPIHKKGDTRECTNHRGISLLSVPGKVYARILEQRLRKEVEHQLEEEQCGFRPGRSTQDHIFTLRQICEKSIEFNKEVFLCFIDLEKAFDRVPWTELWKSLRGKKVNEALIGRIRGFYKTCRNYVRTSNVSSSEFLTTMGVRQGDIGSPLYFITLLDDVIKQCKRRTRPMLFGHWKLQPIKFSAFAFADDLVLVADSKEKLQESLNVWAEELSKRNMVISLGKTKCMVVSRTERRMRILLNGKEIEQVPSYKYLGALFSESGRLREEINARVAAAGKLFSAINRNFLSKREVAKETKLAVYRSTFVPVLTYGSESWPLKETDRSRLQATEMRFLRKIEGKTRRDRIRNTTIRTSLKCEPLTQIIERGQLRWFGHVSRMEEDRLPKKAMEARISGRRPRGRRRNSWLDNIKRSTDGRGLEWAESKKLSMDRDRWRSFCQTSTPQGR